MAESEKKAIEVECAKGTLIATPYEEEGIVGVAVRFRDKGGVLHNAAFVEDDPDRAEVEVYAYDGEHEEPHIFGVD